MKLPRKKTINWIWEKTIFCHRCLNVPRVLVRLSDRPLWPSQTCPRLCVYSADEIFSACVCWPHQSQEHYGQHSALYIPFVLVILLLFLRDLAIKPFDLSIRKEEWFFSFLTECLLHLNIPMQEMESGRRNRKACLQVFHE